MSDKIKQALEKLYDYADGFSVSGVYLNETKEAQTILANAAFALVSLDAQPEAEQPRKSDLINAIMQAERKIGVGRSHRRIASDLIGWNISALMDELSNLDHDEYLKFAPVAAPVQPASKPQDHVIREAINQLTQVAKDFHATQQLRQRIAEIVLGLTRCDTSKEGCTRSHPHEDMDLDCQRKTVEARARHKEASDAPKQAEPVAPHILEALSYYRFERDDLTLDDAITVIRNGWQTVHGRTERQLVLQIAELLAAHPAAQPCQEPAQVRNAALEEAAQVCGKVAAEAETDVETAMKCFDAIRSLQSQPAPEAGLSQPCQMSDDMIDDAMHKAVTEVIGTEGEESDMAVAGLRPHIKDLIARAVRGEPAKTGEAG